MADIELLKQIIDDSGMTITAIAEKSGMTRATLYNRLDGFGEFKAPEIVGLSAALHMSKKLRDLIFLNQNVN